MKLFPTKMESGDMAQHPSPAGGAPTEAAALRRLPSFRVGSHRVVAVGRSRRRRLVTMRLGGKTEGAASSSSSAGSPRRRWWWRRGTRVVSGALRRMQAKRLRWMRLQCVRAARALRTFCSGLLRDLVESGASPGAAEARVMMETYFAVPILPVNVASINIGGYR